MTDRPHIHGEPSEELFDLVDRLCAGDLDDAGRQRLEQLLNASEQARLFYAEYVGMHADLHWRMRAGIMPAIPAETASASGTYALDTPVAGRIGSSTSKSAWRRWAIAAAVALVAGVTLVAQFNRGPVASDTELAAPPTPIATLTDAVDAVWDDAQAPTTADVGTSLDAGRMALRSGRAQMLLGRGAVITVVGPADWQMTDDNTCTLRHGKLLAYVPHSAAGFTLHTPGMKIVDRGTRFGVIVDENGKSEVHVLEGRVDVDAGDDRRASLHAGQAIDDRTGDKLNEGFADGARFADITASGDQVLASFKFDDAGSIRTLGGGQPTIDADSLTQPLVRSSAGSLRLGGTTGVTNAFVDLDVSRSGPFAAAGYIAGNGRIGATGTTLYISWLSRFELHPGGGLGSVGLSLFDAGDDLAANEPLFVGKASALQQLSHARTPDGDVVIDADPSTPEIDAIDAMTDRATHLWVVRIDFRSGNDRIQLYLDPAEGDPGHVSPNAVIESADLTFDRLRFAANAGNGAVYDEVRIGTTWRAVVPGR
ncbi:MAG: hypothetical protein GC159_01680 [Phycisphaera sp.]|nr:hypothetical protein [Phycisphaera sp.]